MGIQRAGDVREATGTARAGSPSAGRRFLWAAWLTTGILAVLVVVRMFCAGFSHDELEHVHSAWLVLQGDRPYVDFFQHHNPALWYYLAPVVEAWEGDGRVVIAARLAQLPFTVIYVVSTYLLGCRLFGRTVGLIATLFLLANVVTFYSLLQVRPDVPQCAFGMLGVLLFFWDRSGKSLGLLFLAGLSLGVSFVFLQKAVFLIAALFAVLAVRFVQERRHLRGAVALGVGLAIPIVSFVVWLAMTNDLAEYYFLNWTLNSIFLDRFSPVEAGSLQFQANAIPWVFAVLSLATLKHESTGREVGLLLVLLFLSLFVVQSPYKQYWLPIVPLMAMFAAHGLMAFLRRDLQRTIAIGLAVGLPVPAYFAVYPVGMAADSIAKMDYVVAATDPGDRLYDGDAKFNLFRRDLDFFWYSVHENHALDTYRLLREYPYDIYELIEKHRPKLISDHEIEDMDHPVIVEHYRPSERYESIWIRNP